MVSRPAKVASCGGGLAALLALVALLVTAAAQTSGVHPLSGRHFAEVMSAAGADWLDRSEREAEEAPDEALDISASKKDRLSPMSAPDRDT